MTVSIIVQRAPGDYQGPIITDNLITTDAQAMARGTAEIDRQSTDRIEVSGSLPLRPWMRPGELIRVDTLDGETWVGMIRHCAITIDRQADGSFSAITSLIIEREAEG